MRALLTALIALGLMASPAYAQSPPTVDWLGPQDGARVSGVLTSADRTCSLQVTGEVRGMRYFIDGVQFDAERAAPWGQCRLDTRNYPNGVHTLRAVVDPVSPTPSDPIADEIKVLIDNPPIPLTVRWSRPRNNDVVSGFLRESNGRCLALVTGSVARAEIYVDGFLNDVQARAPWGCEVDTRHYPNGVHTLTYRVIGTDGTTSEAHVKVRFQNEDPPPDAAPPEQPVVEPGEPLVGQPGPGQQPSSPPPAVAQPPDGQLPSSEPPRARPRQSLAQAKRRVKVVLGREPARRLFAKRRAGSYRVTCRRTTPASHRCRFRYVSRGRLYQGRVSVRDVTDRRDWVYELTLRWRTLR